MKQLLMLGLMILMISCTTEIEEVVAVDLKVMDAKAIVNGCSVYDLKFIEKNTEEGLISFRNYKDFIEVTVTNIGALKMNKVSIHFASALNDFPKTGSGIYNTSKFYYSEFVNKGSEELKLIFSFEELNIATGDEIFISAAINFGSGNMKSEIFASDAQLTGSNAYFPYYVEPFFNYAGSDRIREITLSEAQELPSWDEVRKLYAGMLDPGVNKSSGEYSPSIWDLINDFNDPSRTNQIDEYKTVYTLGTGDCSDSVELTLKVVPDPF